MLANIHSPVHPVSKCRNLPSSRQHSPHRAVAVEEAKHAHNLYASPRMLCQVEDHLHGAATASVVCDDICMVTGEALADA